MPSDKENWLKFYDQDYQFSLQFTLYGDFESILKPVGKKYRQKINQMKTKRKRQHITKIYISCLDSVYRAGLVKWRCS